MKYLFIGRFQPLHKGHVFAIENLMEKGEVSIVIGSKNKDDKKNPFSFSEREKMINTVFPDLEIVGIDDVKDDKEWSDSIKIDYDVVVSNNPWVQQCFDNVEEIEMLEKEKFNGTMIRRLIDINRDWEMYVPYEVVPIIRKKFNI